MRSIVARVLLSVAFFYSTSAPAETSTQIRLPFNFVAKGLTLPAGKYEVTADSGFVTMVNQSDRGKIIRATLGPSNPGESEFNFKFHVRNGTYYLETIQAGRKITENLNSKIRTRIEACQS